MGEKLINTQIDPQTEKMLDVSGLPTGIYFIQLKNNSGEIATKKISIIK